MNFLFATLLYYPCFLFSNSLNRLCKMLTKWFHGCSYRLNRNVEKRTTTGPAGFLKVALQTWRGLLLRRHVLPSQSTSDTVKPSFNSLLYLAGFSQILSVLWGNHHYPNSITLLDSSSHPLSLGQRPSVLWTRSLNTFGNEPPQAQTVVKLFVRLNSKVFPK